MFQNQNWRRLSILLLLLRVTSCVSEFPISQIAKELWYKKISWSPFNPKVLRPIFSSLNKTNMRPPLSFPNYRLWYPWWKSAAQKKKQVLRINCNCSSSCQIIYEGGEDQKRYWFFLLLSLSFMHNLVTLGTAACVSTSFWFALMMECCKAIIISLSWRHCYPNSLLSWSYHHLIKWSSWP